MEEKLTALFYLLIRDNLPAGILIKCIKEVTEGDSVFTFTNPHLEALSKDLVERLSSSSTFKNYLRPDDEVASSSMRIRHSIPQSDPWE